MVRVGEGAMCVHEGRQNRSPLQPLLCGTAFSAVATLSEKSVHPAVPGTDLRLFLF